MAAATETVRKVREILELDERDGAARQRSFVVVVMSWGFPVGGGGSCGTDSCLPGLVVLRDGAGFMCVIVPSVRRARLCTDMGRTVEVRCRTVPMQRGARDDPKGHANEKGVPQHALAGDGPAREAPVLS